MAAGSSISPSVARKRVLKARSSKIFRCFWCRLWWWSRTLGSWHDPAEGVATLKVGSAAYIEAGHNGVFVQTLALRAPFCLRAHMRLIHGPRWDRLVRRSPFQIRSKPVKLGHHRSQVRRTWPTDWAEVGRILPESVAFGENTPAQIWDVIRALWHDSIVVAINSARSCCLCGFATRADFTRRSALWCACATCES